VFNYNMESICVPNESNFFICDFSAMTVLFVVPVIPLFSVKF